MYYIYKKGTGMLNVRISKEMGKKLDSYSQQKNYPNQPL